MFIRWVIRKHKNATVADMTFHDAYLVESYRDEVGNPRQRTVCYLGNIRQIGDQFPTIERELFFLRAERILSSMPEISGPDRDQVLILLRDKVPPLNEQEVLDAFRNNLRWYFRYWQARGEQLSPEDLLQLIASADETIGPV